MTPEGLELALRSAIEAHMLATELRVERDGKLWIVEIKVDPGPGAVSRPPLYRATYPTRAEVLLAASVWMIEFARHHPQTDTLRALKAACIASGWRAYG